MADEESKKDAAAGLAEQMARVLKHFAPRRSHGANRELRRVRETA